MVRKIQIHKSLSKPILFVGCERLPFTLVTTIGGIIIMSYQNIWAIVGTLVFYLTSIILIRRVNESDPQYFRCLYRYITNFDDYYPSSAFYPGKPDKPQSKFE